MSDNIPIQNPNQVRKSESLTPEQIEALQRDASKAQESTPKQESKFPTEIIELPSEGFFYDQESPLASGKIELKYMTAKEEDILTSQNLIKKGIVLDKLLDELIVTPGVSSKDLLVGDRNAIFIAARILAYGSKYDAKVTCPKCGAESEVSIDLSYMANKEFDFSGFTRGVNEFYFELPKSKRNIGYKILTGHDESAIEQESKAMAKINKNGPSSEVTTRLKYLITSVDGKSDRNYIKKFVDTELTSIDARELRKNMKEASPDFDMSFNFECEHCGYEGRIPMPMGVNFFWPDAEI